MADRPDAYASNPLHERESTSLWTNYDDASGDMFVASYDAAGRPEIELYGQAQHPVMRSPCTQIQFVKRRKRDNSRPFYEVVIAGMRSEGKASQEGHTTHELCTHTGWELDALTKRFVVSPCAISVLAEDGERLPDRCELSMFISRPSSKEEPIFVASKEMTASSIRSDVYSPTLTVYPSAFPPPMRVAFNDYGRVYQFEQIESGKNQVPIANVLGSMALERILASMGYKVGLSEWVGKFLSALNSGTTLAFLGATSTATGLTTTALSGALALTASLMAFPLIGYGLYQIADIVADSNRASTDARRSETDRRARILGKIIDNAIGKAVGTKLSGAAVNLTNAAVNLSEYFADEPRSNYEWLWGWFSSSSSVDVDKISGIVRTILGSSALSFGRTLEYYFNRKPGPRPLLVSFTLDEFANSLNVLASTTEKSVATKPTEEETKKFVLKYRRQLILWQWLQDPDTDTRFPIEQSARDGFGRSANPLDTSGCNWSTDFAVHTSLEVRIDDDDICAIDHSTRHRFVSTRSDSSVMGAIANNELANIESVRKATFNLIRSIEAAIERNRKARKGIERIIGLAEDLIPEALKTFLTTTFNLAYFAAYVPFYEQVVAFPILKSILGFLGVKRKKPGEKREAREVYDLFVANEAVYTRVLKNIPSKLQRHFNSDFLGSSVAQFRLEEQLAKNTSRAPCEAERVQPPPDQPTKPLSEEQKKLTIDEFVQSTKDASTVLTAFFDGALGSSTEPARQALLRRYLPHTATGVSYFFPSLTGVESSALDFVDELVTTREISKVQDAIVAYNVYSSKAATALRNLILMWAKNGLAPFQMIHFYTATPGITYALRDKRVPVVNNSFALQLGPPSDMFAILSSTNATEGTELRIQTLVLGGSKKYHGVKATWQHVVALQFYAEIVAIQLMNRHRHQEDWQMATFSTRAYVDALANKCADFVLQLCAERQPMAPSLLDPSTYSTEPRWFAQLMLSRVHAVDLTKRGVVDSLKLVANALKNIAADKSIDWNSIPVEPLAYLRMSYEHSEDGFRRVKRVLQGEEGRLAAHVRSLCAASYPALLLDRNADGRWKEEGATPYLLSKGYELLKPSNGGTALLRTRIARRFESLRINFDDGGADGIASRLESVSLERDDQNTTLQPGRFFVPYGYGDHLPPLSSRSVLPFLFASVPVELSHVVAALEAVKSSLQGKKDDTPSVDFVPSFTKCRSPNIAFVLDNPNEIAFDGDNVRFLSSYVGTPETASTIEVDTQVASTAATAAVVSSFTSSLSDVYSSIAWNAERILQGIVLTACTDKKVFDVRIPSPMGVPFADPLKQERLNEQRTILKYDLVFHARLLQGEINRILLPVAKAANESLNKNLERDKQFLIIATDSTFPALESDALSKSTLEEHPAAFAFGALPVDVATLFLKREGIDDDELVDTADDMLEKAKNLLKAVKEGTYDFRALVRDIGSDDTMESWIFRKAALGIDFVDPNDFTYNYANQQNTLDDLSPEDKQKIVNEHLQLTPDDVLTVETPYRMIRVIKNKMDVIDEKLKAVEAQSGLVLNIHSQAFREQFLVSLVVGQAMARGLLGEADTPSIRALIAGSGSDAESIGEEEMQRLLDGLNGVQTRMSEALKTTEALRLCDLCAITHCIMVA